MQADLILEMKLHKIFNGLRILLYNKRLIHDIGWKEYREKLYEAYIMHDVLSKAYLEDVDHIKRLDYNLIGSSLVIVAGGYKGNFTDLIYKKHGCNILVFEPHPDFFKECKKRFVGNTKIQVFNYGLADINDDLILYDKKEGSSFYIRKKSTKSILCKVRRYSDVVKELGINKVDLMVMNIEGGEYCLMDHIFQQNLISNIRNLQIQFHGGVSDIPTRRQKMIDRLSKTHTKNWSYEWLWQNWTLKKGEGQF